MIILSIETSCDETAISLLEATETPSGTVFTVHGNITRTQIDVHKEFGGVFPALGKREHQKNLVPILLKILSEAPVRIASPTTAGMPSPESTGTSSSSSAEMISQLETLLAKEAELFAQIKEHVLSLPRPAIDRICVTSGPGLEPALWVGINFAKALGMLWDIPVVPVNHMEGHILSVLAPLHETTFTFENTIAFPALALLISGGHTELVVARAIGEYEIIGKTRDDAVGEAFDKVARILGLPYPGGPEISRLAAYARAHTDEVPHVVDLPRPMIGSDNFDFSFSGIKTAVLYATKDRTSQPRITEAVGLSDAQKYDVAREFENAVAEVLVKKTAKAIDQFGIKTLIVGGGVAANTHITSELSKMITARFPDTAFLTPTKELSTDNSLMIGLAGYFKIQKDPDAAYDDIRADGNWSL